MGSPEEFLCELDRLTEILVCFGKVISWLQEEGCRGRGVLEARGWADRRFAGIVEVVAGNALPFIDARGRWVARDGLCVGGVCGRD